MASRITLKKYPNRRLYDTENSTYVTLMDVSRLIKEGRQVQVIDLKTDQDVTAFILSQIIMEQAKKNNSLLPVSLLHLIIRFGETVLGEFFDKYLEQSIQSYLAYRRNMEEQFRICMELGIDLSSVAGKTMKKLTPFQPFASSSEDKDDKDG